MGFWYTAMDYGAVMTNWYQKGFTDEQAYSVDVTSHARDVWSSLQHQDSRSQLMEAMQFLELLLPGYSSDL